MWEAREILWAAFDTRAVYDLHVSVIIGVRELTSSIFYARCLLLGYVRSALCLLMLRKPCGCACKTIVYLDPEMAHDSIDCGHVIMGTIS